VRLDPRVYSPKRWSELASRPAAWRGRPVASLAYGPVGHYPRPYSPHYGPCDSHFIVKLLPAVLSAEGSDFAYVSVLL
jgi:hypothetical protein